jgi:sulfoxide reductase heme-binding subunit YedZ
MRPPEGGAIVAAAALALLVFATITLAGDPAAGLPMFIRGTPRGAFPFLCAAASASALVRLHPSPSTAWLRRNRRALGLSFALWHLTHAAALTVAIAGGQRPAPPLPNLVVGGLVFVLIALMAGTSSDRAVRVMGAAAWSRLHTLGIRVLLTIFVAAYLLRLRRDGLVWAPLAAMGVATVFVRWRARGRRSSVERSRAA